MYSVSVTLKASVAALLCCCIWHPYHTYIAIFTRCICVNEAVVPKIAMLKELEEGLQLHGFLSEIRKHPAAFQPIFTESSCFDMSADDFLERLVVRHSQQQFLKSKEVDILKYFSDFIQALFYEGNLLI